MGRDEYADFKLCPWLGGGGVEQRLSQGICAVCFVRRRHKSGNLGVYFNESFVFSGTVMKCPMQFWLSK